jgi:glutathione synthase/RimK-type ligase-like ATP-grasp enzyme
MTKLTCFDVLIVYTEKLAISASSKSPKSNVPFPLGSRSESYNAVYSYFLEICHKFSLNAAFTTSADIVGPGFCSSFWTFKDQKWTKNNFPCYSALIFDKFAPVNSQIKSRRQLLFSSSKIKSFNNSGLFNLFFDKQKTYKKLSNHSIPTITIGNTIESVNIACKKLTKLMSTHSGSKDFSSDLVMKNRFGAGGRHIYKFKAGQSEKMLITICKHSRISYIIQPFAKFDKGFNHRNRFVSTDIRLIYLQGKIVQFYIRTAKPGEFRCNEHQGGLLTYLPLNKIPSSVLAKAKMVSKVLNQKQSLYSLDFIISNSGQVYFLEGNTSPGLDWNISLKKNEIKSKELIRLIVENLKTRVDTV